MELSTHLKKMQNTNHILSIQLNQGSNAALIISPHESQIQVFFFRWETTPNF